MKKILSIFCLLVVVVALGACKANKKNRCNTCPKWEDHLEWTGEVKSEEIN